MISVIVTDYLRKKYILDALKSIKEQEGIDLKDLELVVVKYYKDKEIDDYIAYFPIHKNIVLDLKGPRHVGYTDAKGLEAASSNIIFFLEDDDLFVKDKVKRILEIMKKTNKTNYAIHHKQIYVDENKEITTPNTDYDKIAWHNVSSFVLNIDKNSKLDLIEKISKIEGAPDMLLYYFKNNLIQLNDRLTYYRILRNSLSHMINAEKLEKFLHDYEYIQKTIRNNVLISKIIFNAKIYLNLFYDKSYSITIKDVPFNPKSVIRFILYKTNKRLLKAYLSRHLAT